MRSVVLIFGLVIFGLAISGPILGTAPLLEAQQPADPGPGREDTASKPASASPETNQSPQTSQDSRSPEAQPTALSPATTTLITEDQLAGLPLNGRSYSQLATLQSGMSDTSAVSGSRGVGGGSLTVAGGRSTSNVFLLDGTNIMDYDNRVPRSAAGVQLGSDAVFQVQVFSPNYGAEYGRNSGGILNSLTRSGTNEFHGTFFEYFRNSKLDARNFFDNGKEPPPFKRNQFGLLLSGPVRKEGTYFMGSFEAMRDRLNETVVAFFPDAMARQGRIVRSNGTIDTVPVNPRVVPYLGLYPLPNSPGAGGIGETAAPQFLPTDENFFTLRVDHRISEQDSLFGRYTFDDASSVSGQNSHLFSSLNESRQHYLSLVGTHIFNLHALATFRFGYTRPSRSVSDLSQIDIPSALFFSPGAPQFGRIEVTGLTAFGPSSLNPRGNSTTTFQFAGDTVQQIGNHTLKWGAELHRYRTDVFSSFNKSGVWDFNSLESFLQGGPSGTSLRIALPGSDNRQDLQQHLLGLYVQNRYRMRPGLQLSTGLRYEYATQIKDRNGKSVNLPDPVHGTEAQIGPFFERNPSHLNFSPRLGLQWSPGSSQTTSVNMGFGLYYDQVLVNLVEGTRSTAPFYKSAIKNNFDATRIGPFPDAVAAAEGVPHELQVWDYRGTTNPVVLRYNFELQQELPQGWRIRASYVGARGNHLVRSYEANLYPAPITLPDGSLFFPDDCQGSANPSVFCRDGAGPINPAFAALEVNATDVQSFYNSFRLTGNKRLGRTSRVQVSYAYAKSVDDASSQQSLDLFQFPLRRDLDRGLSDFDIRHRLVTNFFYSFPFGAGQRWLPSGLLSRVVGGWQMGGIVSLRSGTPFSPASSARNAGFLFSATRPDLAAADHTDPVSGATAGCFNSVATGRKLGGTELYFDPCIYSVPLPGTLGNAGRNTLPSPPIFNMDISLQREFALDTKRRISFRAEVFNLPNHTNFRAPSNRIFTGSGRNPRVSSTAGKIRRTSTNSRQVQFALRFSF